MTASLQWSLARLSRAGRHAWRRAAARWSFDAFRVCCICGARIGRFLPYRDGLASLPQVAVRLDIIGSDVEHFECPACGCHDRERHLFLYMQASGQFAALRDARVLHFAPESRLQRLISAARPSEYVCADLKPTRPGLRKLDLMAIDLPSDRYDFVIANHVLEHVGDDQQALREILRVLRPGGRAILQTPFALRLPSKQEDARLSTDAERLEAYGQEDHCRLYGADFIDYVVSAGFVSRAAVHADLLPQVNPDASGVHAREPFLLFAKPAEHP